MRKNEELTEKTPSLENLREVQLMALLHDRVRALGPGKAAEELGIDRKTVWRTKRTGRLTPRVAGALESLLLARAKAESDKVRERVEGMEQRIDAVAGGRTVNGGEVAALRAESGERMRQIEQLLAQLDVKREPQTIGVDPSIARFQARRRTSGRRYPELVTRESAPDDQDVYGEAWPLVSEWRTLSEGHSAKGQSLSWLASEERIRELEVAMLEEHGLTLPPETQPLTGTWRNSQLNWRKEALYDTRRARARRELLRWFRRVLTLGVWWK